MNSVQAGDSQRLPELSWKEHTNLIRQSIRSWRLFGITFGISILLMVTVGIVFQIVFLFSVLPAFLMLAMLNQHIYSAFLFVVNDKGLPRTLPKPPLSAYFASMIPLLISIFFLYGGVIAFQKTGFCSQSLVCIIVSLIQSLI